MFISPINSTNSTNFKAKVRINASENQHCKYLYNNIKEVVDKNRIPATYKTDVIELPSVNEQIISQLKKFGIKIEGEEENQAKKNLNKLA